MLCWMTAFANCGGPRDPADEFEQKAARAARAFPATIITQVELRRSLTAYLLVDTRAEAEFAVSHLPGAINWPDYKNSPPPDAVRSHAGEGKPVVFYCSIGYRSGEATVRSAKALDLEAKLFNLRGGIFQWANEGGELEGSQIVHGFNADWERLLRPEKRAIIQADKGDAGP